MAYTAGLYTRASDAAATEAQRFRQFQTDIDAMSARERAGLYRRDQAAMDQFTAGLTPQSSVTAPEWAMPAAPPAPAPTSGGVGAPGTPGYERNRLMQERKLLEDQFNAEVATQKKLIDDLGQQKYILEQQLTVAPAYQQQAIRDRLTALNDEINRTVTGTRGRVTAFGALFKAIDDNIRLTDKGQALMSGPTPAAPGGYTPGALPDGGTAMPGGLGVKPQTIPVSDSLDMAPEAAAPAAPAAAPGAAAPPAPVDPNSRAFIASLTPAQFEALPEAQQNAILATVNRERQANRDRANLLTSGAVAYDFLIGAPSNVATWVLNWTTDTIDLPRYARAVGLGDVTSTQLPMQGPTGEFTAAPATDWVNTLRANSQPLTREQFLENLKANEQQASVQAGKGDLPAAGAAPAAQTAPATQALQPTADVAIGDPADPRVAAITKYSADAVAARAEELPARLGAAVASDQGQQIIARAKALGVDPAAAMAIYGIESTFGANARRSGAGAKGPMQVTPAQLTNLRTWFNDPRNIRQYGITPELVNVAKSMTVDSIDAGLMQLKYNELIGLPKNLWGAGYQGNANDVLEAGAPLPVHDAGKTGTAGLTNSDYNKLYIGLYNEARQYVNIPPSTTTSQAGVVGNSQAIRAFDATEQQLRSDYEYNVQLFNEENARNEAKRQEAIRKMQIAQQFSDLTAYEQARTELETLDTLARDNAIKIREVETMTRIEMDKVNLARTEEYIRMAVMELDAGNPMPFAEMVSRGTGMLVEVVPVENGKFAVYQNNQLVSGAGYTLKQLKDQYLSPISASYEAQRAAQQQAEAEWNRERLKAELKLMDDITLEQVKANGEMAKQGWTEGKEITDPNTGRITEKWFTKGNRVIRMRIAPDREENGLVVKGGVTVEEVSTAGLKN